MPAGELLRPFLRNEPGPWNGYRPGNQRLDVIFVESKNGIAHRNRSNLELATL
jgi:hypothetical protein